MRDYAGGISSGLEPVDANALIWDLSEALTDHLPPEVELRWDPAPDLPAILADPGQIRQVVQNLFENAREAMEGRKGRIRIATGSERPDRLLLERCSLVPRPLGGLYVRIEVSDEGCGMDEETRARMFEPFFSTSSPDGGWDWRWCGGGPLRGGAIDVESAPGGAAGSGSGSPPRRGSRRSPGRPSRSPGRGRSRRDGPC
jgi:signal transduction histidine kinase